MNFAQGAGLNHSQLSETISRLKHDEDKIAGIIADNSKLTREMMMGLFTQGESKDLEYAKSHGVINAVKMPTIPKDAKLISINFWAKTLFLNYLFARKVFN